MQDIDVSALCDNRRELHRIAEIGYQLPKTNAYLRAQLADAQCTLFDVAETGLLAYFDAARPRTFALRADMDGLPIRECTGKPYASIHPGQMHACGHDAHMAMLLSLSSWLSNHYRELPFNVLLIFQPAEESGAGGDAICKSGLLEQLHVERVVAIHVEPNLPLGTIATRVGAIMARSSELDVVITGRSAHAARAREGVDAMRIGAEFLLSSYEMAAKTLPADVRRLLHFGTFHSGSAQNAVSSETILRGTLRAYDDGVFFGLLERMKAIAASLEHANPGSHIAISASEGYPPVLNDACMVAQLQSLLPVHLLPEPYMLADDFGFYVQRMPGLYLFLGLGTGIPLHSDAFDVPDKALTYGVNAYIRLLQGFRFP